MSMQLALRPYVTAGIALVGASVIAVSPIVPSHADVHLPAVNLTASIDNPIEVFAPVVNAAGSWITNTIQSEIANPFPILHQIITNQITTAAGVLQAIQGGAAGVGEIVTGLPAALQAAGAKLAVGDVNGAIDAIMAAGLNPFLSLISGVWTPLQPVLERPFQVGLALVPALFDAALSVTVGVVLSTVGIGFDTGTTPFIQQIVKSTQAVLTAVTTLNPINVLNAIQHGIADVTQNFITQLDAFTTGTIPYIRDTIVRALQAPNPAAQMAAISAPEATAPEATTPEVKTPTTGGSDTAVPVKNVVEEGSTVVAEPTEGSSTIEVTAPEAVVTPEGTITVPVKEIVSEDTSVIEAATPVTAVKVSTGSTTVTRDSLKAEPGKTGLASGTGNGSGTAAESADTTTVSEPTKVSDPTEASSAPSSSTGTSANSDSGSDSDKGSSSSSDSD